MSVPGFAITNDLFLTDLVGEGLLARYEGGLVDFATNSVIEQAVAGTVVVTTSNTSISTLQGDKEDKSNKGIPNGYAELDSAGQVPASQLGNAYEPPVDKGAIVTANGTTTTNLPVGLDTQALVADSAMVAGIKWASIDHVNLLNKGTNTHPQIDAFMASEGQPNGLATLDGAGRIPLAQLANLPAAYPQTVFAGFTNTITTNGTTGNTFIQAPDDGGTSGDLPFFGFDFASIGNNAVSVPRPQAPTSAVTFDAGNSQCTVNSAGEYLHTINVRMTGPGSTARWGVTLYCSGKIVSGLNKTVYAFDDGAGDRITFSASTFVNAGDTFSVRIRLSNNNSNLDIEGCSWFCTQLSAN
ncbi:hypothetical protein QKT49_gp342 [Acanthamoeba castellanii medusavirus]|uniref:Uncharacterized protein n=1 Tax=Acanthamoeba castellanii medusavirus J1 TaxID=3114988 RepID=A0A3T1CX76_9VIRU|nr:hypothetical protein QKT49_gp342 [Acanthamoeba castellanii medusavirus]BBI30421.1 hypothetical protein [Acanthamoeba castellanii medusavirus J1]